MNRLRFSSCVLILLASACSDSPQGEMQRESTPVTLASVMLEKPSAGLHLTGVVVPFREERIAFEVAGRLISVENVGFEASGAVYDEQTKLVREGTVLAEIDDARYVFALESARLRKASAEKNLEAMRIDLGDVAKADLDANEARLQVAETQLGALVENLNAARSDLKLARTNLERERNLLRQGASAQATLDQVENRFRSADATVKRLEAELLAQRESLSTNRAAVAAAEAALKLKEAQIEATQAEIDELEQSLQVAARDLSSCKLRAPFDGRVTVQHVGRGTFVNAGTDIVTMTLFDPIKIQIAVSSEQNRRILPGMPVKIQVNRPGEEQFVFGAVTARKEVADASTRTFTVDILVRNPRILRRDGHVRTADAPISRFFPAHSRRAALDGPRYVNTQCLFEQGGKFYVLKLPDSRWGTERLEVGREKVLPEKVEVTLQDEYIMILQWSCRSVGSPDDLQDGDLMIMKPETFLDENGEPVELTLRDDNGWTLLPGDLVTLDIALMSDGEQGSSLYVPADTIVTQGERAWVFVRRDGRAVKIPVTLLQMAGDLRAVEAEDLKPEDELIRFGRHYVSDGDHVHVSPLAEKLSSRGQVTSS